MYHILQKAFLIKRAFCFSPIIAIHIQELLDNNNIRESKTRA
jgi:hypothetical protein